MVILPLPHSDLLTGINPVSPNCLASQFENISMLAYVCETVGCVGWGESGVWWGEGGERVGEGGVRVGYGGERVGYGGVWWGEGGGG